MNDMSYFEKLITYLSFSSILIFSLSLPIPTSAGAIWENDQIVTDFPRPYYTYPDTDLIQFRPRIATNDNMFAVVWTEEYNPSQYTVQRDIYAARVENDGTVLDTDGILIETDTPVFGDFQVADICAVNDEFWITYAGDATVENLYTSIMYEDGATSPRFQVGTPDGLESTKHISVFKLGLLMAWNQQNTSVLHLMVHVLLLPGAEPVLEFVLLFLIRIEHS